MIDDSTINATIKADLIGSKETKALHHRRNVQGHRAVERLSRRREKDTAGKIAKAVEGVGQAEQTRSAQKHR
jgi:hypothetical protein